MTGRQMAFITAIYAFQTGRQSAADRIPVDSHADLIASHDPTKNVITGSSMADMPAMYPFQSAVSAPVMVLQTDSHADLDHVPCERQHRDDGIPVRIDPHAERDQRRRHRRDREHGRT